MLRRKAATAQSQPTISLPIIQHPLSEGESGGNRTSVISVEETNHVSTKEYEITDGGNSNMKVVVRVRPENEMEMRSNCETVVKVLDDHVLVFDPNEDNTPEFQENHNKRKRRALLSRKRRDLRFAFDRVFDENSQQVDVFKHTTKSVLDGLLDGVNCSVFAYGATGAGKTHTMLGSQDNPGVMFLTTMELYRRMDQLKHEKNCQIAVTYLEVYNETICDLLSPSGPLPMREDSSKGLVVAGLTQYQPTSAQELLHMLEEGNKNRTQHPTDANATSSRSHAVFQVYVIQKPRAAGLSAEVTKGKMSLIDLAGSERATITTNRGARFREGANINKSLLALGNCINALASNKDKTSHVPYRNSKLTRLLKDSLGGSCKTVMIANISPSSLTYEDTYNTLKYADRAKQIKTKLVRNVVNVDYHVTRYRTIVVGLQKEIEELKGQLHITGRPSFNIKEADRLKTVIGCVYEERTNLRKNMAELDAAERDTLLRVLRKERELQRIDVLTGNDKKMSKVRGKLDFLRNHLQDIKEQKTVVHLELSKNNESIGKTLSDINSSTANDSDSSCVLRNHVDLVFDSFKLEAENCYQWKQTKHLLKYIKNQEKDMSRTEKILTLSLDLINKQFQVLQATNCLTPVVHDLYDNLLRQIEGEKEVGWVDRTHETSHHDMSVSSFAPTHQALMDTITAHSSPLWRTAGGSGRYSSPMNSASLGLLSTSSSVPAKISPTPISPKSPLPSFGRISPHPLSNRLVAISDKPLPLEETSLAGKILTTPARSPRAISSTPAEIDHSDVRYPNRSPSSQVMKKVSHGPLHITSKDVNQSQQCSPMISPKLRKKRVSFNSPPPAIQEEADFDEDENVENVRDTVSSMQRVSSECIINDVPPSPPPRNGSQKKETFDREKEKRKFINFLKDCAVSGKNVKQTSEKTLSKTKVSVVEKDVKVRTPSSSRHSSSPVHSKTNSPSKYRINLAELTSISQSTYTTTATESVQQQPVAPMVFPSPVINAFEDNFVSSYPTCSKRKLNHTPVGKSRSIDNPTYIARTPQSSLQSPPPPTCTLSPTHSIKPVVNQHPAFLPPPPPSAQHSASPRLPQKPAFLPVLKSKTTPRLEYRSPINIPVHSLPSFPHPPIPSPSSLSKSRSNFKSSSSSSCSQLSDGLTHGFLLHPALSSGGSTVQISKTTKSSHRYSLTSPTQTRDNVFLSSNSSNEQRTNDSLNSTFTISKPNREKKQRYAVLEPVQPQPKDRSYHVKKTSPNLIKPIAVLQVGLTDSTDSGLTGSMSSSTEKKLPNYLSLTKSAAFKKVQRTTHQMKNQKENLNTSNGMTKSQSVRAKSRILVNRSINNRAQSVSTAS